MCDNGIFYSSSLTLLLLFSSSSCLPSSLSPPSQGGKAAPKKRAAPVERGTTKNKRSQVDESWLPEGTIPSNSFISLLILIQSSSEHYICSVTKYYFVRKRISQYGGDINFPIIVFSSLPLSLSHQRRALGSQRHLVTDRRH